MVPIRSSARSPHSRTCRQLRATGRRDRCRTGHQGIRQTPLTAPPPRPPRRNGSPSSATRGAWRSAWRSARPTLESVNARYRWAICPCGRIPTEQVVLKFLYLTTRSLDPTWGRKGTMGAEVEAGAQRVRDHQGRPRQPERKLANIKAHPPYIGQCLSRSILTGRDKQPMVIFTRSKLEGSPI